MADNPIPTTLVEMTPAWLNAALAGQLPQGARIASVAAHRIGLGEGLVGSVARLELRWAAGAAGPSSLIAKLPAEPGVSRTSAELLGLYEREVRFYRELGAASGYPAPRCYHAEMDPGPDPERAYAGAQMLERVPELVLRLLLRLGRFVARRRRRRYVLVLEDLAPARVLDQVAGCSEAELRIAVETLARAHAHHWNAPALESLPWLLPVDTSPRLLRLLYHEARRSLPEEFRERLGESALQLADRAAEASPSLYQTLGAPPHTLIHGDYRPDNLFLDAATGGLRVGDWQVPQRGRGAYDLAYFLSASLPRSVTNADERALVDLYHATLRAEGVSGYRRESLEADLERAWLIALQRAVAASQSVEFGNERGREMVASWLERLGRHVARRRGSLEQRLSEAEARERPPELP